jgi:hypothetical protein
MASDPKPARGTAKRARRKKNAGKKDRDYLAWLHTQGCIICQRQPIEAHHERSISRDDAGCIPLCYPHHRGEHGRHGLRSLDRFQQAYGVCVRAKALELRGQYLTERGDNV